MSQDMLKNHYARHLEERKDARKRFGRTQPIVADCSTMDAAFKATIQDVSSAGVFLKTERNLLVGQEIAMTFTFPYTREIVRATEKLLILIGTCFLEAGYSKKEVLCQGLMRHYIL